VELAYRAVEAFNRRDWDDFVALIDDEVELESRLVAVEGRYRGHEGLRRWWEDILAAFPDYSAEIEVIRDLGDVTLTHIRGWAHGAGSTAPVVDPSWELAKWRDGKLVWWRSYSTEPEALEAAGLSE